jgi:hypothetical protein
MFRLNMQIGNLMQHVVFDNETAAKAALADLFTKKLAGSQVLQIAQALVNPQAVNFAHVGRVVK